MNLRKLILTENEYYKSGKKHTVKTNAILGKFKAAGFTDAFIKYSE